MKKILITATAVGAAIAGIILYNRKRSEKPATQIKDAAKDAYQTMNAGIGQLERNPANAMG
jgi:hypothetical protein